MLGILPPEELSTAVKLAANVLKALPCPDPFVMALAARVYGESGFDVIFSMEFVSQAK